MDMEDDPLQIALATAFADSTIVTQHPPHSASPSTCMQRPVTPDSASEHETQGSDALWKEEYDQLVSSWREESAAAREKAEMERERWRLIRETEAEQQKQSDRESGDDVGTGRGELEWETVEQTRKAGVPKADSLPKRAEEGGERERLSTAKGAASFVSDAPPRHGSPCLADARDIVTGETPRGQVSFIESLLPHADPLPAESDTSCRDPCISTAPHSITDDQVLSNSRTWEEVPSLDSSFPSLSFPDRSAAPSPEPRERPSYQRPPAPPSVTLAIFDSSLSPRARILAFVSSLAINLFLPFVNGVMLGFGEIFAKNLLGSFGWSIPGTAIGIRAANRRK